MPQTPPLTLTIRDRLNVVYDGPIVSLSSVNEKGPFDVLASHTNFISIIKDYLKYVTPQKRQEQINLTRGVLKVNGGKCQVFLGLLPKGK